MAEGGCIFGASLSLGLAFGDDRLGHLFLWRRELLSIRPKRQDNDLILIKSAELAGTVSAARFDPLLDLQEQRDSCPHRLQTLSKPTLQATNFADQVICGASDADAAGA
jgi:hypothetical protein